MSMPFYVSPEQFMKDKADYAIKNIARGRPLVATVYGDGILLTAENPSTNLHKISEIYDRIAFGGVGRYSEFDQLRQAGIQHADVKGYQYSREDVDARSLANLYGQFLNQVFTHEMKPYEVEILVAEVGTTPTDDRLFRILYDGNVADEDDYSVVGKDAEAISERIQANYTSDWTLIDALKATVAAVGGPDRTIGADELEVAVLERSSSGRAFRRIDEAELTGLLG
jgi:proteasome alpha subunit